jgi:hypothetical protein
VRDLKNALHDWTLSAATVNWGTGTAELTFAWDGKDYALTVRGLSKLVLPRTFPWGPSVSVNSIDGPTPLEDGLFHLSIEMQSGDVIELSAVNFDIPSER